MVERKETMNHFPSELHAMIRHLRDGTGGPNGRIFVLQGNGSNGKTCLLNTIQHFWTFRRVDPRIPEDWSPLLQDANMKGFIVNELPENLDTVRDLFRTSDKYLLIETNLPPRGDDLAGINLVHLPVEFVTYPPYGGMRIQRQRPVDLTPVIQEILTE